METINIQTTEYYIPISPIETSGTSYQGDPDIKILNNSSDEDLEKMKSLLPDSMGEKEKLNFVTSTLELRLRVGEKKFKELIQSAYAECKECVRLGRECDASKIQKKQAMERLKE